MGRPEVVIVGAGPAGAAAALGLAGRDVLLLDVGHDAPESPGLDRNLYRLRRETDDLFAPFVGEAGESLHNLFHDYLSPKLKAPLLRYVTARSDELAPVVSDDFHGAASLALGGLANAWGAGLYRFDDQDLEGFPLTAAELANAYDELTEHIGIAGADDDLAPAFGSTQGLLPPLELDQQGRHLLARYGRRREAIRGRGVTVGLPRLGVLSRPHRGREAYDYAGLEFFRPRTAGVYTPAFTVRELAAQGRLRYRGGCLVESFREGPDGVEVVALDLANGEREVVRAGHLILAAGPLNTARLVLASARDTATRLPLLDNPISYVPLLAPALLGAVQEERFFAGVQLNVRYVGPLAKGPIQGSFYGMNGVLRTDSLPRLPLAARSTLAAARDLVPALAVVQLFYPDQPSEGGSLRLAESGAIEVALRRRALGELEKHLLRTFRRLGYFGSARLHMFPGPGSSYHYAGTLPMRERARGSYETDRSGRLGGRGRVFVADASVFPTLPSKNHSFTVMANALRIARELDREMTR